MEPSMDYTPSQVNCREECNAWCDSGGEGGGSYCCGNGTICDTQWCNAGGCTMSPSAGAWLQSSQYRANGGWSPVHNSQLHDARCDFAVPAGSDCHGNQYVAYVGMVRAVHCYAPATPIPADVNGDGLLDVIEVDASGSFWVNVAQGRASDVVVKINDGIGQEHQLDYAVITDGDPLYSRATEYALSPVGRDIEVVKQVRSSNGVGGLRAVSYNYEGGNIDPNGRGFLGFHKVTSTDHSTGHVTVKTFHGGFPVTGTEAWEGLYVGGVLVRATEHQTAWTGAAPFVLTRTQTQEWVSELDGSPARYVRTSYGGYAFGFPGTVSVETRRASGDTSEVVASTTTNTYVHDTASWILGRLTRATVTKSRTGAPTETRTSAFTYQVGNGLLASETIEPDDASLRQVTTHGYDLFGNRVSSTETAGALSRTQSRKFDANGRFVVEETNALGHLTTYVNDARFGTPTRLTDPNGAVRTFVYDPLGRKIGESTADGHVSAIYIEGPGAGDAAGAALVTRTVTSHSGTTRAVTDALGRTLRKTTDGFGGRLVHVDTAYGASGLKLRESRPYFTGETRYDHVFTYDALGRELSATSPDGKVVLFAHQGRTVAETDPLGRVKTKTETVDGKSRTVAEVTGGRTLTLTHAYDAHGQLVSSTDPTGIRTTIAYDRRGRRTSITEPNAGTRTFMVDGFGRVTREVDAKGQRIDFVLDALDRVTNRKEYNAAGTLVRESSFTFDTAVSGAKTIKGALASASVSELKAGAMAASTSRVLGYDSLGRVTSETKTAEGTSLRWARTYSGPRVSLFVYPGTLSTEGIKLFPVYDAQGRVVEARLSTATGRLFWRADAADASGNILQERLDNGLTTYRTFDPTSGQLRSIKTPRADGLACVPAVCTPDMATWNMSTKRDASGCFANADSGRNERLPAGCSGETPQDMEFVFDALGNLTSRKDNVTGLSESFQYDALDRLTRVSGPSVKTLAYDDAGNIISKSDFGDYSYDATRGHLVTSVKKGATTVATYAYDANGNVTSGGGRTFTWNGFDKPSRIDQGTRYVEFVYDDTNGLAVQRSNAGLRFFGDDFELLVNANGSRERRTFIKVGGLVRAVHTGTVAAGATTETSSTTTLLHDHLGSTSVVLSSSQVVRQRLSYDAHGKRRFTIGTDDPGNLLAGKVIDKGFTGHQMLDDLDLVFMGARVYDPMLGRFLSADLIVQSTSDVNGINRYVYGGNNPISVIDPSGHFFKKMWKAIRTIVKIVVAVVVTAVVAWVAPYLLPAIAGTIWQPVVVAAASGAIMGGITGGVKGALIGALTGAITAGIGVAGTGIEDSFVRTAFKSVTHGLVSGARDALSGGSFVHGFISGFVHGGTERLIDVGDSVFERVALSAAISGAASKVSGGSFENGAMSGAFAQLFNHEMTRMFQDGEPFFRQWQTPAGTINVAVMSVRADGTTLVLHNLMVYRAGEETHPLATREGMRVLRDIQGMARGQGFTEIHITGTQRMSGARAGLSEQAQRVDMRISTSARSVYDLSTGRPISANSLMRAGAAGAIIGIAPGRE
ncbi:MAG: hypothetical protein IPG50_28160 [Myxococcales bacterium]|nr:hypothetical protein [Myxococcales bacterium]